LLLPASANWLQISDVSKNEAQRCVERIDFVVHEPFSGLSNAGFLAISASESKAFALAVESTSEAERRKRFGLLAGNISLMPNGTLDGFNCVLDFDESLTHVFRITAIVFLRQTLREVAPVRNVSVSCCDQSLNALVILNHSGGLP
jgi:hypothetical protein